MRTAVADWQSQAACAGHTTLFFAGFAERPHVRDHREHQARALCQQCPVLEPCREWARARREYGFWGGESEEERAAAGYPVAFPVGRVARVIRDRKLCAPDASGTSRCVTSFAASGTGC